MNGHADKLITANLFAGQYYLRQVANSLNYRRKAWIKIKPFEGMSNRVLHISFIRQLAVMEKRREKGTSSLIIPRFLYYEVLLCCNLKALPKTQN